MVCVCCFGCWLIVTVWSPVLVVYRFVLFMVDSALIVLFCNSFTWLLACCVVYCISCVCCGFWLCGGRLSLLFVLV